MAFNNGIVSPAGRDPVQTIIECIERLHLVMSSQGGAGRRHGLTAAGEAARREAWT